MVQHPPGGWSDMANTAKSFSSRDPCESAKQIALASETVGARKDSAEELRTTVMLRGLPASLTQDVLVALLDPQGFAGEYDFVYLPVNFASGKSLSYAFVNMTS